MTYTLDFVGFAEGATMDYRGNISVAGFCPQFIGVSGFPAQIAPFFLVIAENEDVPSLSEEESALLRIQVEDEGGNTLFRIEQASAPQKKTRSDMPGRMQILAQIPLLVTKPGKYLYKLDLRRDSDSEPILEVSEFLRVATVDSE